MGFLLGTQEHPQWGHFSPEVETTTVIIILTLCIISLVVFMIKTPAADHPGRHPFDFRDW